MNSNQKGDLLSVVVPAYNEQEGLDKFHRRTSAALASRVWAFSDPR